jgi:NAD(P)-dependent dehydrogenase (short-subunit alcohol dehydrogenase family)
VADLLSYAGKRVIVSGCFSGMGEATARTLVSIGAEVHGVDYKQTALSLASFTNIDLREPASIDAAVAKIGGPVDALFNCAGLPQTFPPLEVMKVNYLGTRYITEKVLPLMKPGSAIACIASTAGFGWSRHMPQIMELIGTGSFEAGLKWCEEHLDLVNEGYSFSKEAIIVWTMFASSSFIKQGIRINCTLPGPTETPMMKDFLSATAETVIDAATQPINRRSTPLEQAYPLIFLNSDLASYVNGVVFPADGGFMGGVTTGQVDLRAMMGAS